MKSCFPDPISLAFAKPDYTIGLKKGISANSVTTKRNIPSYETTQGLNTGSLPIVITGTLPRDEHSLRLIRQLNALSTAGRVEVFYYPEKDNEDELQVLVEPKNPRLVNPARVPEDLQVSGSVQGSTDELYYKAVDKQLRANGTPAVVIAFPEKVQMITSGFELRYEGTWNDARENFRYGTPISVQVFHNEQPAFLNHRHTLERISAANIESLVCLKGPTTSLTVDIDSTREQLIEQMLKADGSKFSDEYIDQVMVHICQRALNETPGYSTTGDLTRAGMSDSTCKDTSKLTQQALEVIDEILARDPQLTEAIQTASSILAAAQEEAQKIIDDAKFSELETLSRLEEIERETIARIEQLENDTLRAAQDKADELTDAAIEASQVIPELADMLRGGPLAMMTARASKELQAQSSKEQKRAEKKQLGVKTHLDIVVASFKTIDGATITSWGAGWETQSFKRNIQRSFDALKRAKNGEGQGLSSFDQIELMIDTTNLGHQLMGIEDATLAIGLHSFVRETRKLDTYRNLERLGQEHVWRSNNLESWDIDQTQMDRAFLESLLAHCSKDGFSENDRKFLDTCDHILAGEISQSLRRSLDGRLMQRSFGEIEDSDPFAVASDTNGLLDEIEEMSHQQSFVAGRAHIPGSLRSTLEEVNLAASQSEAERSKATTNRPTELHRAQEPQVQPMAMRSDGSVVQFPQR